MMSGVLFRKASSFTLSWNSWMFHCWQWFESKWTLWYLQDLSRKGEAMRNCSVLGCPCYKWNSVLDESLLRASVAVLWCLISHESSSTLWPTLATFQPPALLSACCCSGALGQERMSSYIFWASSAIKFHCWRHPGCHVGRMNIREHVLSCYCFTYPKLLTNS